MARPPLWRDDEGASEVRHETPAPKHNIWRDEETTPAASSTKPAPSSESFVWRENEDNVRRLEQREPGPAKAPRERRERKRARPRQIVAMTALILALLLVADGAYVLVKARSDLNEVHDELALAKPLLREGSPDEALPHIQRAVDKADSAVMLTRHPVVPLASFVPGIGEDARALAALARSGRVTAQASVALVNAERQLGATDETFVEALNRDGRVNVRALAAATPDVEVARALLVDASEILTLPRSPRVPEFAEALRSARADVGDALDSVTTASDLLAVISEVVGGNGERRFLLAFQALGEARATGGLVGIYGVLDAESGALRLAEVAPYGDLEAANGVPVSAPPWFWTSYQPQRALEQWPQANVSPNFPVVADIYLQMYERSTGDALDGVIALDPIALEMLLRATDPVRVPRLAEPLTSQNAGDVLMRRSYLEFDDPAAQNDFLRAVVTKVFGRLRDGAFEERALADALAEAATTRHLKIYSRDEGIQERVTSLGVDDNVHRYGPNVQMVFHNNYSVNKVDYFLRREVDVKIRLTEDGDARVTTELALQNGAPRGPKSLLLGPGIKGDPAGMNRMLLSFLVPAEANVLKLEVDGEETAFFENTEAELPVAWQMVEIPPREVRSARLSYVIRRAAQINEAGGHFSFTLYPQTLANPDRYNLSVTPPPDMTIAGPGRASGKLLTPKTIEVSFERAR